MPGSPSHGSGTGGKEGRGVPEATSLVEAKTALRRVRVISPGAQFQATQRAEELPIIQAG